MKFILSPAKQMKEVDNFLEQSTVPLFQKESQGLLAYLKSLPYTYLKALWKCSDKIALESQEKMKSSGASPALLAYDGIAFKYMAPLIFEYEHFDYVQDHLRILSGMYGILRPLDMISFYRLEMQAKVNYGGYKTLYDFWGSKIYDALTKENEDGLIIDLASKEYSSVITPYLKETDTYIQCSFLDDEDGKLSQKGVYCKMARGSMVRFMAENGIKDPEKLKAFQDLGYQYREDLSSKTNYVFTRKPEKK